LDAVERLQPRKKVRSARTAARVSCRPGTRRSGGAGWREQRHRPPSPRPGPLAAPARDAPKRSTPP